MKISKKERDMIVVHVTGEKYEKVVAGLVNMPANVEKIEKMVQKRESGVPLAQIFGEKYFFGEKFVVSRSTLVPRLETEFLVEMAMKILKKGDRVADVGAGTGCVGISLAKSVDVFVELVEPSVVARKVLKKNAENVKNVDISDGKLPKNIPDMIVSNPPYLTREEFERNEDLLWEPKMALLGGGADGLKIVRGIIAWGVENGVKNILIEMSIWQAEKLKEEGIFGEIHEIWGTNVCCFLV